MIRKKRLKPINHKQSVEFWKARKKASRDVAKYTVMHNIRTADLTRKRSGKSLQVPATLPKFVKNAPVYVLIRTSRRPEFFKKCYESIKKQTYKNIVTIVHTDDPRDDYVTGDIIVRGNCYHPKSGTGTFNLYNNRLLDAIPKGWGWYHMIDDDDMYHDPKAISKLVKNAQPHMVNVARVKRWGNAVWPKNWRRQRSFQTECFFIHTAYKDLGRWWANKGGDHYYSRQMTNRLKINWIEGLTICKAQEGKGHGKRMDKDKTVMDYEGYYPDDKIVDILIITDKLPKHRAGKIVKMKYKDAWRLDKKGLGRITFGKVEVVNVRKHRKQAEKKEAAG